MQYIDMVLFGEDFQFQHGIAPGREDQASCTVIAIGNYESIARGQQALGYVAKCPALYLQYNQIKIHTQAHELRMNGIFAVGKANFPAAEYVVLFQFGVRHSKFI